jgi:chemotaxis protein MotB
MADAPRPRVIRRKRAHAAHHGGAWKVAYADFVTAMMALFIVLWLLTQADLNLKQQIAQYFRNPGVLPSGTMISPDHSEPKSMQPRLAAKELIVVPGEQDMLDGQRKEIERALEAAAHDSPELSKLKDQVIVQVTDAGLSIQVVDKGRDMLFDVASANLKPPVVAFLTELGRVLGRMPNRVQIGGHTDSRPFVSANGVTNWDLAFARANAARRVLEANGLWPGQIHRVVGYADSEPLVPDNPYADENRRLSILAERREAPPAQPTAEVTPEDAPIVLPPDPLPGGRTASDDSTRRDG